MYWLTGILGLALVVAPYLLGYYSNPVALTMSVLLGLAIIAMSVFKRLVCDESNWEYGVAGILGAAAFLAPSVLGFGAQGSVMLVLGAMVAVLSAYQLFFGHKPEMHEMH